MGQTCVKVCPNPEKEIHARTNHPGRAPDQGLPGAGTPPGLGVSVRSLFKSAFTDVPAVTEISFTVQPGEMHGLIRPRAGEVHQRIQLTFRNRPRLVVTIRLSMYD